MNTEPFTAPIANEADPTDLERIAQNIGAHPDTYVLDCAHCRPVLKHLLIMIATQDDNTAARALLDTLNRAHKPLITWIQPNEPMNAAEGDFWIQID